MPVTGYLVTCDEAAAEYILYTCKGYFQDIQQDLMEAEFLHYSAPPQASESIFRVVGLPLEIYDGIADRYVGDKAMKPRTVGVSVELVPYLHNT